MTTHPMAVDDATPSAWPKRGAPPGSPGAAGSGLPECMSGGHRRRAFFDEIASTPPTRAAGARCFRMSRAPPRPLLWPASQGGGFASTRTAHLREITSAWGHPTPLVPWVRVPRGSPARACARRRDGVGPATELGAGRSTPTGVGGRGAEGLCGSRLISRPYLDHLGDRAVNRLARAAPRCTAHVDVYEHGDFFGCSRLVYGHDVRRSAKPCPRARVKASVRDRRADVQGPRLLVSGDKETGTASR